MMDYQAKIIFLENLVDHINLSMGKSEGLLKDLKQSHDACESGFRSIAETLAQRVEELKLGSASRKDMGHSLAALEGQMNSLVSHLNDSKSRIDGLEVKFVQIKEHLEIHRAVSDSNGKRFAELQELLQRQVAFLLQKISEASYISDAKDKAIHDKMQKDLEDFKSIMVGSPSSLEGVKTEIFDKFENVRLDASNAVLKSNYLDLRVKNLEKVVENLSLMVKQLESR